jgi:hypothetical protein
MFSLFFISDFTSGTVVAFTGVFIVLLLGTAFVGYFAFTEIAFVYLF